MATYSLIYTKRAFKDVKKLDRVAQKRLKKSLEKLVDNPLYHGEKLIKKELGEFRFRVGDYRVIYDIDKNNIVILRVGHRREVYNK